LSFMSAEPVTIFRTFSSAEAELIRSRLEAAGFTAELTNELAPFHMEGYSLSTGGIRVVVPSNQAIEARSFLDSFNEPPQELD